MLMHTFFVKKNTYQIILVIGECGRIAFSHFLISEDIQFQNIGNFCTENCQISLDIATFLQSAGVTWCQLIVESCASPSNNFISLSYPLPASVRIYSDFIEIEFEPCLISYPKLSKPRAIYNVKCIIGPDQVS